MQLLVLLKARVLDIVGLSNADWVRSYGVIRIAYGNVSRGWPNRLRKTVPNGIDALIDLYILPTFSSPWILT
ncbi:hypothetical protein [Mycobacterium lepromatosis]|uniref:hypothetical protein n=1 Tax=Mycobacterium lepromatosis TaxID=480418 RepID=UPI000678CAE5|nr:hypothetical protein [Mycobacterium lepromatosis]UKN43146.1 hypothetical protein MLPF_3354 [Mycobacterium lepromatosis]